MALFAVLSPYAFSICDTTAYEAYQYGGITRQVKGSSSLVAFVSKINFSMCVPCVVMCAVFDCVQLQ